MPNKSSIKIIGENTDLWAQGYFVYDSKKSGSVTVSHLRFGPQPIRSTYLIDGADFVALPPVRAAREDQGARRGQTGATFLLNSPYGPDDVWDRLPIEVQQQIVDKQLEFWVIDAFAVATETGMGSRINTVMQPCFFQLSGVLPGSTGNRGDQGVRRSDIRTPRSTRSSSGTSRRSTSRSRGSRVRRRAGRGDEHARDGARRSRRPRPTSSHRVTARLMAGDGDQLPVSALPVDGTFPTGTAKYEKRAIAKEIPIWDPTSASTAASAPSSARTPRSA